MVHDESLLLINPNRPGIQGENDNFYDVISGLEVNGGDWTGSPFPGIRDDDDDHDDNNEGEEEPVLKKKRSYFFHNCNIKLYLNHQP